MVLYPNKLPESERVCSGICKGSKERIIQICSSEVLDILKEYYALVHPQTFFFVNRLGNKMSEQSVRLLIKKCVTGLQMNKRVTPHTFRHTFATLLLERGVDDDSAESVPCVAL